VLKSSEKSNALPILSFGHAGDGNLHIYFLRGDLARDKWLDRSQEVMEIVYEDAQKLTGQVSGEHGIGYAKRDFLAQSLGPAQMRLLQGIKATFDPKGLLNPGKVVS
jgi:glycolate oxidase